MDEPRRRQPLRAAVPVELVERSRLRSLLVGVGVGLGVGLAGIAMAFSIIAIPLFMLASVEPERGLDRDLVRRGLFELALPFGLVTGVVVGIAVGVWSARGGRLPTDRSRLYDR